MMLEVLENDSSDIWLGYIFGDDAVASLSPLKGSKPIFVGLDVEFDFGAGVRLMFSSIDHMLSFKEEPFMKEALDRRATRRESSVVLVAEGRELDWMKRCISLARAVTSGSLEPTSGTRLSTCSDPDASTGTSMRFSTLA